MSESLDKSWHNYASAWDAMSHAEAHYMNMHRAVSDLSRMLANRRGELEAAQATRKKAFVVFEGATSLLNKALDHEIRNGV